MDSELGQICNALGSRLGRAVAIDDPHFHLQAYSPHYGPVDDTRLGSILYRKAPDASVAWVHAQGVANAHGPVRVAGNDGLGIMARVCAPMRYRGMLLGYLWLIDDEQTLSDADMLHVGEAAEAAAAIMYRERLLQQIERGRERDLMRDLLSHDEQLRRHGAERVVADGLLASGAVAVLVIEPRDQGPGRFDERLRTVLEDILEAGRRRLSPAYSLQLSLSTHAVFLVVASDPALRKGLLDFGRGLLDEFRRQAGAEWDATVGVGDVQDHVGAAVTSYWQARRSIQVARAVGMFGQVACWSHLGVYGTLAQLSAEQLTHEALHQGLLKLFAHPGGAMLVQTLECYLDLAGDAKSTASALHIHRSSLYYRLGRIEDVAGVDLRRGEDRLSLHLGLKVARLGSFHPTQSGWGP